METVTVEEGQTLTLKCVISQAETTSLQWLAPSGFTIFFSEHSGKWRKSKSLPGLSLRDFPDRQVGGTESGHESPKRWAWLCPLWRVNSTQKLIISHLAAFTDRKSEMETPPKWLVKGGSNDRVRFHQPTSPPCHFLTLSDHENHQRHDDRRVADWQPGGPWSSGSKHITPHLEPAALFSIWAIQSHISKPLPDGSPSLVGLNKTFRSLGDRNWQDVLLCKGGQSSSLRNTHWVLDAWDGRGLFVPPILVRYNRHTTLY